MMRSYFNKIIVLVLLLNTNWCIVSAQGPGLSWVKQIGNSTYNITNAMVTDHSKNVYTTGLFYGAVDFDPGPGTYLLSPAANTKQDMFISKLDPSGNFVWALHLGDSTASGIDMVMDASENLYVSGYFQGTADFDPGPGVSILSSINNTMDIFILKLDAGGNFIWAKQFGGYQIDHLAGIAIDSEKNVYTTGNFMGPVDFDPGPGTDTLRTSSYTQYDGFVSKLDSSGNFLWAASFGAAGNETPYDIKTDIANNVYITGTYEQTVDFDPGAGTYTLTSAGLADCFLLKLNPTGNFVWAKKWGGGNNDFSQALTIDLSGNYYLTGQYQGTVDFDPGPGSYPLGSSNRDVFLLKLDTAGNFIWANKFGGTYIDYSGPIVTDASKNIYVGGSFNGTVDCDPGVGYYPFTATPYGYTDIFICKLDSTGAFIWAEQLGGVNPDQITSLELDDPNIYISGNFQGTCDFDPDQANTYNLTSAGDWDVYILKLGPLVTRLKEYQSGQVIVYPNPNNGLVYFDLGAVHSELGVAVQTILGETILEETYHKVDKFHLFIKNVPGIYFVTIYAQDGNTQTLKIIKE